MSADGSLGALELATDGTMPLLFSTPDDWVNRINEVEDLIVEKMHQGLDEVWDRLRGLDARDLLAMGLVSPAGALGLFGGSSLLSDRLEKITHDIVDRLDDLWDAVQGVVDELIGNPAELMELSHRYLTVKSHLSEAVRTATKESAQLGKYWGGLGHTSFETASSTHTAAMDALTTKFESAVGLMASAAEALKLAWSQVVKALLDLASSIVDKIASGLDLGNIFTGDAGPVVALIGTFIDLVNDCSAAVRNLDASAETTGRMRWMVLSSGSKAFDHGAHWPSIDRRDSSQYADAGLWDGSAGRRKPA